MATKKVVTRARAKQKPPVKQSAGKAEAGDEADPRFVPVAKAFAKVAGFSLMESKSRAMRGLMLRGKSFGMSIGGRLVLKMNEERAAELIAQGVGKPFNASAGKVLRAWIEVTSAKANWVTLAKEAHRLAEGGAKRKP